MPVTDSFLTTCRTAITALPELTTFRTALASVGVGTIDARRAAWTACYGENQTGGSPAYRLAKAIRETVLAQAGIAGTLSPLDRESAYRTMEAEFVPTAPKPPTRTQEEDELRRLLLEQQVS